MKKQLPLLICFVVYLAFVKQIHAITSPVINEFVAHPSNSTEWVEFYNPDHIDLSSYYIDDDTDFGSDAGNSAKKVLQGINTTNPDFSYIDISASMLNNGGDSVVLFDAGGNIVDQYTYSSDPGVDVSIGKSPDGNGSFAILAQATKGSANSPIVPTPTFSPTPIPTVTPTPKQPTATPTTKPNTPTPTKIVISPVKKISPTVVPSPSSRVSEVVLADALTPTHSVTKRQASEPTPTTTVLGSSTKPNRVGIIFFSLGGLLFAACGILLFRQYHLSKANENDHTD